MSDYRINNNYAKALLMLSTEQEEQKAVFDDMQLVGSVCKENHELSVVFANPTIKAAKKIAIVEDLFKERVMPITFLFLCFVVKQNRSINLRGISQSYIEQYRKTHGIVFSEVITAVEVDDESLEVLRQMVADYTHLEVEQENHVDNRMLGGFRLLFDNNMYDARIRTKIKKLHLEFDRNNYESKL